MKPLLQAFQGDRAIVHPLPVANNVKSIFSQLNCQIFQEPLQQQDD